MNFRGMLCRSTHAENISLVSHKMSDLQLFTILYQLKTADQDSFTKVGATCFTFPRTKKSCDAQTFSLLSVYIKAQVQILSKAVLLVDPWLEPTRAVCKNKREQWICPNTCVCSDSGNVQVEVEESGGVLAHVSRLL